jgi:hypothetical protein
MSNTTSRSYVLNDAKRKTIIALVTNGSSRRAAARYVGCSASTISRTVARDPRFAAELARAEQTTEIGLLRAIHAAAKETKHWRAAAWLLERRSPDDFAARPPNLLTDKQVADVIAHIIETIHGDLTEETYRRAFQKLDELLSDVKSIKAPIIIESDADDFGAPQLDPTSDSWPQLAGAPSSAQPLEHLHTDSATGRTNSTFPPKEQIDLRTEDTSAT